MADQKEVTRTFGTLTVSFSPLKAGFIRKNTALLNFSQPMTFARMAELTPAVYGSILKASQRVTEEILDEAIDATNFADAVNGMLEASGYELRPVGSAGEVKPAAE